MFREEIPGYAFLSETVVQITKRKGTQEPSPNTEVN